MVVNMDGPSFRSSTRPRQHDEYVMLIANERIALSRKASGLLQRWHRHVAAVGILREKNATVFVISKHSVMHACPFVITRDSRVSSSKTTSNTKDGATRQPVSC